MSCHGRYVDLLLTRKSFSQKHNNTGLFKMNVVVLTSCVELHRWIKKFSVFFKVGGVQ
jgi:hypothetical protein